VEEEAVTDHPGREALRRMVETAANLRIDWFWSRVQKGHGIMVEDREHMCSCNQTAVQQVAAYVAELERGCAIVRDDGSATATLLAAQEAEVRHLKERISELEAQVAEARNIFVVHRDDTTTDAMVDAWLARTAPKEQP